jgi:hypothetical protein
MSISIPPNAMPEHVFEAKFGMPPGTKDPKTECEQWQQLCDALLIEHSGLRAELDKARLENIVAEWNKEPIGTMAEVYATVVKDQTFEELIAELENRLL